MRWRLTTSSGEGATRRLSANKPPSWNILDRKFERAYVVNVMIRVVFSAILALWSFTVKAQVQMLWKSGVSNVTCMESAVDSKGNVVVGGFSRTAVTSGIPFIMKFDPLGNKLWELQLATNSASGIDDLAIDQHDRIILSARLTPDPFEDPRPVSLIQISPGGLELWRRTENFAPGSGSDYTSFSAIKVDSQNNIFMCWLQFSNYSRLAAARYTEDGLRLWYRVLPADGYVVDRGEMSRFMSLTYDGGFVFAGKRVILSDGFNQAATNFLIRLDSRGRTEWQVIGQDLPDLSTLAVDRFNRLCVAVGEGVSLFNLRSGRHRFLTKGLEASDVLTSTPDGGFLMLRGNDLIKLNGEGHQIWSVNTGLSSSFLGVVSDGAGGWIAAGKKFNIARPDMNLVFVGIANNGGLRWQASLNGFPFQDQSLFWRNLQAIYRAPDGSLRVVVNETSRNGPYTEIIGIGVYSFAINR